MMKQAIPIISALAVALLSPVSGSAQEDVQRVRCNVQIANSSFGPDICEVGEDSGELSVAWAGAGGRTYRIRLVELNNGEADGYWNGFSAGTDAVVPIGSLSRSESCWRGSEPTVSICLYDYQWADTDSSVGSNSLRVRFDGTPDIPIPCDVVMQWEERALLYDSAETAEQFVSQHYANIGSNEAWAAVAQVYNCEFSENFDNPDYEITRLTHGLYALRGRLAKDDPLAEERSIAELRQWIDFFNALTIDDREAKAVFRLGRLVRYYGARNIGNAFFSDEAYEYDTAESAASLRLSSAARDRQEAINADDLKQRLERAIAIHGDAVDAMGFPSSFLEGTITLDGMFRGRRWITLREWIAALLLTQKFDMVEGSQLTGLDAYGVVTKLPSQRPRAWYFTRGGDELFLTYVGDSSAVYPIRESEKFGYAASLKSMIR